MISRGMLCYYHIYYYIFLFRHTNEILAIKLHVAITLYQLHWKRPNQQDAYDLQQDFLTKDDWEDLIQWQKILIPFRQLYEREEG